MARRCGGMETLTIDVNSNNMWFRIGKSDQGIAGFLTWDEIKLIFVLLQFLQQRMPHLQAGHFNKHKSDQYKRIVSRYSPSTKIYKKDPPPSIKNVNANNQQETQQGNRQQGGNACTSHIPTNLNKMLTDESSNRALHISEIRLACFLWQIYNVKLSSQ